ncbi:MAG TPA: hypothetical protein ENL09_02115 [Bacteroidetes bacterium]|nr:hypothetical protein [Bacteroidota bacterium]
MRKAGLAILLIFIGLSGWSQGEQSFVIGESQINFGLGFSNRGIPIYGNYEVAVSPEITVGGQLSMSFYTDHNGGYKYNNSAFTLVGFGNYHFNEILEIPAIWDVYAGLNLGYSFINTNSNIPDDEQDHYNYPNSGLYLGIQIGGRYYWNDQWALNFELGGGSAFGGKVCVTYRLD